MASRLRINLNGCCCGSGGDNGGGGGDNNTSEKSKKPECVTCGKRHNGVYNKLKAALFAGRLNVNGKPN